MTAIMPRKTKFPERRIGSYRPGTLDRIQRVLDEDEDMTDFFREAVDRELERREQNEERS